MLETLRPNNDSIDPPNMDLDNTMKVLSNERRRFVIELLAEEGKEMKAVDIAPQVAEQFDCSFQSARISLIQVHSGVFEQTGALEIHRGNATVYSPTEDTYKLNNLLQHLSG